MIESSQSNSSPNNKKPSKPPLNNSPIENQKSTKKKPDHLSLSSLRRSPFTKKTSKQEPPSSHQPLRTRPSIQPPNTDVIRKRNQLAGRNDSAFGYGTAQFKAPKTLPPTQQNSNFGHGTGTYRVPQAPPAQQNSNFGHGTGIYQAPQAPPTQQNSNFGHGTGIYQAPQAPPTQQNSNFGHGTGIYRVPQAPSAQQNSNFGHGTGTYRVPQAPPAQENSFGYGTGSFAPPMSAPTNNPAQEYARYPNQFPAKGVPMPLPGEKAKNVVTPPKPLAPPGSSKPLSVYVQAEKEDEESSEITLTFRLALHSIDGVGKVPLKLFTGKDEDADNETDPNNLNLAFQMTIPALNSQPTQVPLYVKVEDSKLPQLDEDHQLKLSEERDEVDQGSLSLFDKIDETKKSPFKFIPKKKDTMKLEKSALSSWMNPPSSGEINAQELKAPPSEGILEKVEEELQSSEPKDKKLILTPSKCCEICQLTKPLAQFFVCDKCEKLICLSHFCRDSCCQTCFLQQQKAHPFYEKIYNQLLTSQKNLSKVYPSGEVNFLALANVLNTISEHKDSSGLIVIGNTEQKKGFCFLEQSVMLTSFGRQNILRLGKLLVQTAKISEEQLAEALKIQKESKSKLGEILVANQTISANELKNVVTQQICKEMFMASRWKKTIYKYKPGKAPADVLESMSIDFHAELDDPFNFRKSLSSVFQHLYLIMNSGVLFLESSKGRIGLLVEKDKIDIVNFQPKAGFLLGEELLAAGKITAEQLKQAQHIVKKLLGDALVQKGLALESEVREALIDFLIQQGFVEEDEVKEILRNYIGKELLSYLKDPKQHYEFYEGTDFERNVGKLFKINVGLDLADFIYNIFEPVEIIPPLLNSIDIFTLVFDKPSSKQVTQLFHQEWVKKFDLKVLSSRFTQFELAFLILAHLKSNLINNFRALQQHAFALSKNSCSQETCIFLESALQLVPNSYEVLNFLAQTYSRIHLTKQAIATYKKIIHWFRTPQEYILNAKILFQLDPSNTELGQKVFTHLVAHKQIQNALKIGEELVEQLKEPQEKIELHWKLIRLEETPRNAKIRESLLELYLTENNLKGALSVLDECEAAFSRTKEREKLEVLYRNKLIYDTNNAKELKNKLKNLANGIFSS